MKLVIAGGTGQVGAILLRALVGPDDQGVVLTRTPRPRPVTPNIREVAWDGRNLGPWLAELDGAEVVINLAGRSVDCRYGEANLAAMMSSRVDSTRAIGAAIARAMRPPAVWLQASTATLYAHRYDAANDEAYGLIGGDEPGVPVLWGRSIAIALAWERELAAAQTPLTRKVALRSAMVMSPDAGGVFDRLAGLSAKGVGRQGDGRQFVSWIHEADFVAAVRFILARPDLAGAINLASPGPLPNSEFMAALRRAQGGRVALPIPRWMLEIGAFGLRTETELILKSRRVVPSRLLEAGFSFRYPRWAEAAADLVHRRRLRRAGEKAQTGLTRWVRVLIELFGPPLVGAGVVMGTVLVLAIASGTPSGLRNWKGALDAVLLVVLFSYFIAGLPSMIYAGVMEWRFSRGLDPRSWASVGWSAAIGALSGLAIGLCTVQLQVTPLSLLAGIGLVVGTLMGALIRALSRRR